MRNNQLTYISILILFIISSFHPTASSETTKDTIQHVVSSIKSIQQYQVNLNAKIFPPDVYDLDPNATDKFDPNHFIESNTIVYGVSGKKMKIITITKLPQLSIEMENMLIFDGKWLWIEQKTNKYSLMESTNLKISAMKIHIPSVSPDPINGPFNTIYSITGIGLFSYSDLPGTLMKLIEDYSLVKDPKNSDSNYIVFSGNIISERKIFEQFTANKELSDFMDKRTSFCKIWVSKNNGLINAYSLGNSEERPTLITEIDYVNMNQKLPNDTFTYFPPEGVVVKDITKDVLKQKGTRGKVGAEP